jgi:hypothetical protein
MLWLLETFGQILKKGLTSILTDHLVDLDDHCRLRRRHYHINHDDDDNPETVMED